MTSLDLRLRTLALRLINNNGSSITLQSIVEGPYNPATGQASHTTLSSTVKALVQDGSQAMQKTGTGFEDDATVGGEKLFTVAAVVIVTPPSPGDKLLFNSSTWKVLNVKEIWGAEEVITWELWCKR